MILSSTPFDPSAAQNRTSSVSHYSTPHLSADARVNDSGDGGSHGLAARAIPDRLTRSRTDPSLTGHVGELRPRSLQPSRPGLTQTAMQTFSSQPTSPVQHQVQSLQIQRRALPVTHPALRPRYYVMNPDPESPQQALLLTDNGKIVANDDHHAQQSVIRQSPHNPAQYHSHLQQQYSAAVGEPHSADRPPDQGIGYDEAMTRDQVSWPSRQDSYHVRQSSSRAGSVSSGVLTPNMRLDLKTTTATARPAEPVRAFDVGTSFEKDQVAQVVEQWNSSLWHEAEMRIKGCLPRAVETSDRQMTRRMHHLLGAIASIQGQWQQALLYLISVFRAPITDDSQLDDGDCAAAYWLGDVYCLLDRRAEAFIAYSIAEQSSLFRGTQLHQRILSEQKACLSADASKGDFQLRWEREVQKLDRTSADSILHPRIVTSAAEKLFLDRGRVRAETKKNNKKQHVLDQNHNRVMAFRVLGADAGSYELDYRLKIGRSAFDISKSWPLLFDPHFAIANVLRGRMLTDECDLLSLFKHNPAAKIPKAGRNQKANFTCQDLQWLIMTIRECLSKANMIVSEVANAGDHCFVARFPTFEEKIGTIHFLTIALFRQSFTSGYGVDIASDGLYSARIMRGDWLVDKGVPSEESNRTIRMIREHLEAAAGRQEAAKSSSFRH